VDFSSKKDWIRKMPSKYSSKESKAVTSRFADSVLISESVRDFEDLYNRVEQDLQPQGIMESRIVRRIAQTAWEMDRYQRAKTNIINLAFKEALLDLLQQLGQEEEEEEPLSERWFNEPEAKQEVKGLLKRYGLNEYAIEAEAVRKASKELESMESILGSSETRLKNALGALTEYKNLAVRSRTGSNRVIEAEPVARLPRRSSPS
jgi:hypothetical protein